VLVEEESGWVEEIALSYAQAEAERGAGDSP